MGSTRRRFTAEYKAQAVELVRAGGTSISVVARNIGVHQVTLGNWVKKAKETPSSDPAKPLDINERAELEKLRVENAQLQMQLAFAKKVATWFASEKQ